MANTPLILSICLLGACLGDENTGEFLWKAAKPSLLGAGCYRHGRGTVCHLVLRQLVQSWKRQQLKALLQFIARL